MRKIILLIWCEYLVDDANIRGWLKRRANFKTLLFLASLALIISYVVTLYTLSNFPIYSDEIAVRLWLSRAGYDFPNHVNIVPSCESFLLPLAWVWMIPAMIEWLLHGLVGNLHTLRLVGQLFSVLMVGLLAFVLTAKMQVKKWGSDFVYQVVIRIGVVLSLLCVGLLPVFLVTNRPEQIILSCLIILLFLTALLAKKTPLSTKSTIISMVIIYLCISLMLYVHPKGMFLAPVYFFIGYYLFARSKRIITFTLFSALLLVLLLGNYRAWSNELQCNQSPKLDSYMKSLNINPLNLVLHPTEGINQLSQSLSGTHKLITHLTFQEVAEVNYLPSLIIQKKERLINNLIKYDAIALFLLLIAALIANLCYGIATKKNYSKPLLLLLLLGCVIAGNILNLTKSWYDAGYFWTAISIIIIFYIADIFAYIAGNAVGRLIILYLMIVAIFSLYVFNVNYKEKFIEGYPGPGVALHGFRYSQYQAEAKKAADSCLLDAKNSSGLVLDDYTYLYFKEAKNPILFTYISHHTEGNQFSLLIQANKIKAIIVRCDLMPLVPNLQEKSVLRFGSICCYPENKIQQLQKK